ncbi:Quinone oxidoreductase 1 [Cronobacter sakazakii]|nr:Quinone oxidoreductase 1 [Cronobacter sakazakii]
MATRIEFSQHGGPEVLKAVTFTPADPDELEVQVENKAIGINYIDTYIRSGLYPPPALPAGLGTEAAGRRHESRQRRNAPQTWRSRRLRTVGARCLQLGA